MDRQLVGILLNDKSFNRMASGKLGYENLAFYGQAAESLQLHACFFRLKDIRLSQQTVKAYVYKHGQFQQRILPLPKCIHNRALYFKKKQQQKLRRLQTHSFVFNGGNRYGKLTIHHLLMKKKELRPHLPHTVRATEKRFKSFMKGYDRFFLKPDNSSIGRGIWYFEKTETGWMCKTAGSNRRKSRTYYFQRKIPPSILKQCQTKTYLLQQPLPLATYDQRPFDLRVSVQRNGTGNWQVTGMVGKVAPKNKVITNIAQGGTAYPLETLVEGYPNLNLELVQQEVCAFSLEVAQHLGNHLPNLADIGLDIGITKYGYPLFIECNGRDLRYSFYEGGMPEIWKATYTTPLAYAKYILEQQDQRINSCLTT